MTMLKVLVLHMGVHDNTSGHLQLVILRFMAPMPIGPVLVMLPSIFPPNHLWVETISVNQDITQGQVNQSVQHSIQTILSGMEMAVLPPVHVAYSTILHISLSNSPALPLMI